MMEDNKNKKLDLESQDNGDDKGDDSQHDNLGLHGGNDKVSIIIIINRSV